MKSQAKVYIIMINYNRANDTIQCIDSVLKIDYNNYKILVIDNCSTDDSYSILRNHYKNLQIVKTDKNLGFTGGVNFGIKKALLDKPDYILNLNNDTIVENNFLTELVTAMEKYPDAAAAGGLILAEHDRKTIWYAGGRLIKWRGLAVHNHKNKSIDTYSENEPKLVSFITGCMILLRTKYLNKIGLQDERFFMYLDDIEYSARILNKGFKLVYNPNVLIYHKILDKRDNPFLIYYSFRNRLLLIKSAIKGIPGKFAMLYFLVICFIKIILWKFSKKHYYKAALYGLMDYYKGNFNMARGVQSFLEQY